VHECEFALNPEMEEYLKNAIPSSSDDEFEDDEEEES